MSKQAKPAKADDSRRDFIKKSSMLMAGGAIGASSLRSAQGAHAFGDDTIKIGLVGCGGRGTGATIQALNTSGPTKLVAVADAFADRQNGALRAIHSKHPEKVDVPKDRQFVGFDAYKNVLQSDCDLVILATPPGFRPLHFEAAINAGKHVFMEKPVAVDGSGVRRVLAATAEAKKKSLAVAVGLQRRHEVAYKETMAELKNGAIGDILLTRAYWNGGGVWTRPRQDNQTELEYQMRNWYYFNWLCGDHIVEQHIHNLDVINWLADDFPVEGNGMGGREVRTSIEHGQIFDHHFVEFTYANGMRMYSQCRHIKGCYNSVSEHAHGSKGWCDINRGRIYGNDGELKWSTNGARGGHQQEHHDLFADLREGKLPNEGEYGAKSTMTSILGRLCTYSGKKIAWDKAINSDISLANVDAMASMDDEAPVQPNDQLEYPVPVPGKTKVV